MKANIQFTVVTFREELLQILELQKKNLAISITNEEKHQEGFVTVEHTYDLLKKMNDAQPHIIAKDDKKVVGYALSMTKEFANHIPILTPLFHKLDSLIPETQNYSVMGQICIDKSYRRMGIFRGLYNQMKNELMPAYSLLLTEVATENLRSLKAHQGIGFSIIETYLSDTEWNILEWSFTDLNR